MRQWQTSHVLIRDKWTKLMIPKGWKNTKSAHQIKPAIKISTNDPICGALKMMINSRPIGAPLNLFLRPLEKWKVSYKYIYNSIFWSTKVTFSVSLLPFLLKTLFPKLDSVVLPLYIRYIVD